MQNPFYKKWAFILSTLFALGLFLPALSVADSESRNKHLGIKGGTMLGDGVPSNDMIMYGLYGRYNMKPEWYVGIALDYSEFDFERPNEVLGLSPATEELDALAEVWYVTAWIEKEFLLKNESIVPFASAELGVGFLDVSDIIIPLQGGGQADITTDPGTEILAGIGFGVRFLLGDKWFLEPIFRLDHHFADWTVQDRVSGTTRTIDDYTTWAGQLGFGLRF